MMYSWISERGSSSPTSTPCSLGKVGEEQSYRAAFLILETLEHVLDFCAIPRLFTVRPIV